MHARHRYAILAEGRFGPLESKTANQALRYLPEQVVAVIDSRRAGATAADVLGFGGAVPVVAGLPDALRLGPDALLIGIAPMGGILPAEWLPVLRAAIGARLHLVSGLHTRLAEVPELADAARAQGVTITDLRAVPPAYERVASGAWRTREAKTVLTVGTDCNVGKMTASLELHRAAERRGIRSAFVATGQTGILLSGAGVAVDSVLSDFVAGAIEFEVDRAAASGARLLQVEGQGAVTHQGYSGVALGLLHGVMPDAMVLVHHPARHHDDYGHALDDVAGVIRLHESLLAPFKNAKVAGIAVNGVGMSSAEAAEAARALERATGLPAVDVLTKGRERLLDAVIAATGS